MPNAAAAATKSAVLSGAPHAVVVAEVAVVTVLVVVVREVCVAVIVVSVGTVLDVDVAVTLVVDDRVVVEGVVTLLDVPDVEVTVVVLVHGEPPEHVRGQNVGTNVRIGQTLMACEQF